MACIKDGLEGEYRDLIRDFTSWSDNNCVLLITAKTEELIVDFCRVRPPLQPVNIRGEDIEVVQTYKYLGVHLDNNFDWSTKTDEVYKKGQSWLFFLRRLRSFVVCSEMLLMFYQFVVAGVLFYGIVCWGRSITAKNIRRLDKLIKKFCAWQEVGPGGEGGGEMHLGQGAVRHEQYCPPSTPHPVRPEEQLQRSAPLLCPCDDCPHSHQTL